jgi:hypothetical protein
MCRLTACLLWLAALLVVALLLTPALAAPAASAAEAKKTEYPAEKIKKALDQTTDLEITDQPLHLAVNQLREQTKVNFVIDRQVIALMGMDPEQMPVNVKVQNTKLRSGLRSMLGQYQLTYAIVGDAVVITTEDMAIYRQLRQRVNVDCDRTQFGDALKDLARQAGTNLLLDPRVHKDAQTPVTLQLDDVPLETAVRLMCEMADLKPVRMGNVLFVTNKGRAAELRQEPDLFPAPQPNPNEGIVIPGIGTIPGLGGLGGGIKAVPVPAVPPLPVPPPPADEKPAKPEGETRPPAREDR